MGLKVLKYNVNLKSTSRDMLYVKHKVYTNDQQSVKLEFTIVDMTSAELANATAEILLYMQDKSFYQIINSKIIKSGNVFSYTLEDNQGKHDGSVKAQLIITDGTTELASQIYEFDVIIGLDQAVATEVMIQDWNSIKIDAQNFIDQVIVDEAARIALMNSISAQLADIENGTGILDDAIKPAKIDANNIGNSTELYNQSTNTLGYYVNATQDGTLGALAANSSFSASDWIPVKAGNRYDYFNSDLAGLPLAANLCFYDNAKVFKYTVPNKTVSGNLSTWIAEEDGFIRFTIVTTKANLAYFTEYEFFTKSLDWLHVEEENLADDLQARLGKKWLGKTANFIGDSITYGHGLADITKQRYSALVKTALGLATENNYGISSTRLANNVLNSGAEDNTAMSIRYTAMSNLADIVFVMAGTNDYGSGSPNGLFTAPFGTFADRSNNTFYGALHVLYNGLIDKYPAKKIVVITPIPRIAIFGLSGDYLVNNPSTNKNLKDYVNAIREVAEYYSLPILDLFSDFGGNPIITSFRKLYIPDGLHPNAAGHQLIAEKIVAFAKTL